MKTEFPEIKGLSERNLVYMQTFASNYPHFPFPQPPVAELKNSEKIQNENITQPVTAELKSIENKSIRNKNDYLNKIPWTHHTVILDKIKLLEERLFYIKKTIENNWSKSVLTLQIQSNLYQRQGKAVTNFEMTLPKPMSDLARETLKNPYLFDFLGLTDDIQERELENALIKHIRKFTLELGRGFAYVGNQFNLKVDENDYFLDLLFYNYQLHCFVVFELKVGEFKPEYTGKLNFYINVVNEQVKGKDDAPTIGVLLCKTPNDTIIKYSLKGVETPMSVADYEFTNALPKTLKGEMPSIEELEQEITKEIEAYKENINPVDARLLLIKTKLKNLHTEKIQIAVNYNSLKVLYEKSLKPLYTKIISKLSEINQEFQSHSFGWNASGFNTNSWQNFENLWNNETNIKTIKEIEFFYNLYGFKAAGTDSQNEYLTLKLHIKDYSYEFSTFGLNSQEPFLKKLYHQQLSESEVQQIIDILMSKVMDKIDWIIERIESSKDSK